MTGFRPDPILDVDEPSGVPIGKLKLSRFNIRSGQLLFNSVSGALVSLEAPHEAELKTVESHGRFENSEVEAMFKRLGFVVDSDINELRVVRAAFLMSQGAEKAPMLTIAPTLDCNFGCEYCFESHRPGAMSPEVRGRLIDFLRARHGGSRTSLHVAWFGGEPLMAQEVIFDLSSRFDELVADETLSDWDAEIITNGLLLNEGLVERLATTGRVRKVQVTIDGDRESHDGKRFLKRSGAATFDRVVRNVITTGRRLPVGIRVNVDRTNAGRLAAMMSQFADAGVFEVNGIMVYLAPVEPFRETEVERGVNSLLTAGEFGAVREEFLSMGRQHGWPVIVPQVSSVVGGVCQVDNKNAFVVHPDGTLMKCWAELGNAPEPVGSLADPGTWKTDLMGSLEDRDPFDDAGCRSCKMLPLCMGGCPQQRALWRKFGVKHCPPMKYAFGPYLARLAGAQPTETLNTKSCGGCDAKEP